VQRLVRWLLICADRLHGDQFKMSQEFLSHMLGSTRPTVTLAAGRLKKEKLITYERAEIAIVDRKGFREAGMRVLRDRLSSTWMILPRLIPMTPSRHVLLTY
jgi:Mn-dependent DtxR family transcriptional regulator